ncbi:Exportin-6 [Entomortierella chlamydospora]|nr:Exportin-6 [Entomortierella chlamydospora]
MDALEQLLAEFFGPGTSTERKRSIEAQLEGQQPTLDDCRYMLTNAQSDYLAWFATSQYQKRIQAEWSNLDPELQHINRSFLIHFLQQHFGTGTSSGSGSALGTDISAELRMESTSGDASTSGSNVHFSPFVLNKVVQLVTDIALLDWPARFQDLFPEIHKMIQSKNKNHALLGWTLLEAIVQEFVGTYPAPGSGKSNRVHLTLSQQKRFLWEHFKAETQELLTLIVQHLDLCYNKMLVTPLSTEAPAPSPVEHSIWGTSNFGRRPSMAAPHINIQMNNSFQNSFSASKAVPGSMSGSGMNLQGDHSPVQSYGKSPTTMLRKSLGQFLGGPNSSSTLSNDSGIHMNPTHSPAGPGFSLLHARQRIGSISDLGQMAMRRNSINAAVMMDSRRNSIDNTFISGSRMDSHSRKTCMLALQVLTALLACPGLDPRQISFTPSITVVLKFTTLHQNKTVDLGILALSCLNSLVARPGFLATNQDAMTGAVRIMADLIRYFNEVKDGIDDIDESYLQMFMHFVSLFCTLVNLERAEKTLGLSKPDFLTSFARFTLEKVTVDYLKVCMDVWKSLLEAIIHAASDIPRPIPPQHALRRIQGPLLYFMSALVEKFYKMKGATRSEDAFSTFEVEDEEDLEDLTDLVESFVGLVAEVFTEEVIEMLNPLLSQQLELYSRREIDDCKTLPATLGILSRVAYNFDQNFEDRREYTSNLIIHLVRMTKISIDYYLTTAGDAASSGKDDMDLIGAIPSRPGQPGEEEDEDRIGITPDDELFILAYSALSNGIILDPKANHQLQAAASQFRIHRCLAILRALIDSVNEASVASRAMVHEGLKPALPLVQEYFDVYREDPDISIDILLFFKALVKGLYRQIGTNQCVEIARALMERYTNPSLLEAVLSTQLNGHNGYQYQQQTLHQQSIHLHQRKALQRIHITVSILKTILELPGKEISLSLSDFMQFLFSQLGPRLLGVQNQRTADVVSGGASPLPSQQHQKAQEENGLDNSVYDLMALFFSTIKTILTHHTRFFFTSSVATATNGHGNDDNQRAQMFQSCMESFARGLHRPEPEIVRQSIEILMSLQEHNLCHLFERAEFQTTYRSEFLKIMFRIALTHQQDLLLEEIAGLIHKMVIAKASGSDMTVWDDLKKFVLELEPSQVLVTNASLSSIVANAHSPTGAASPLILSQGPGGSSPHTPILLQQLQQARYPVAAKEALWDDLKNLGDESLYREGLYEFVNDAQVYAQNLLS